MAYPRQLLANFGAAYTGLATVGYTLPGGSRTTTGVTEAQAGTGSYTALASITDGTQGLVKWDTGGGTPVYAFEEINPREQENADVKTSSISAGSAPTAADNAAAVWNAAVASFTTGGTFGGFLQLRLDVATSTRLSASAYTAGPDAATISAAVWNSAIASYTTGSTFGGFLQNRLDVAVSSRLASTAGITPADVWAYTAGAGRTLTTLNGLTPNSAFFTNAPSGGGGGTVVVTIAAAGVLPLGAAPGQGALPDVVRGDDYAVQIDLPESVVGVTGLWLAIKRGNTLDVDSVLFIAAGSSPSILNGGATASAGTFTIDDAANGLVTLSLPAETTRLLAPGQLTFSVKKALSGTARRTLAYGSVNVVGPFIDRLA